MKTKINFWSRKSAGYALLMVLTIIAASMIIAGATISRTYTVAKLNDRNNQYTVTLNAAEAAVEKAFARLAYDFQSGGFGLVTNNELAGVYATNIPTAAEDPYWANFEFSDGARNVGRTYVHYVYSYSGPLPSQYSTPTGALYTSNAPVYRILSNAKMTSGRALMTNAVQEDILMALVPVTQYAIFYNGLLEFSSTATMTVNGKVHGNTNIYVGSGSTLTFNSVVTASGTITSPANNGNAAYTPFPTGANVNFNGTGAGITNGRAAGIPTVTLSINMTNAHSMIEMPPNSDEITTNYIAAAQRLYNQAQVVILVSNATITTRIQQVAFGQVPGADTAPVILTNSFSTISSNLPFLTLTNKFFDQREQKTNLVTQVDLGKYAQWLQSVRSNNATIDTKFSSTPPTILYVADNRTASANQLTVVRITNGIAPPSNGGLGFSLATLNPLYVWGNYNQSNPAFVGTTNTSSGTVPSALMSDALTILSSNWVDSHSLSMANDYRTNDAVDTTVNAALITGVVPSIDTSNTGFSGGVHNLPRLLEDWQNTPGGRHTLTLNTSIVSLFSSTRATALFRNPGNFTLPQPYYDPPTRQFSYDYNYQNPAKVPPGVPCALIPIRFNWAVPPPNTLTYNVTP